MFHQLFKKITATTSAAAIATAVLVTTAGAGTATIPPRSAEAAPLRIAYEGSAETTGAGWHDVRRLSSSEDGPTVKRNPFPRKPPKKKRKKAARKALRYGPWRTSKVSWYGPGFYGHTMAGGGKLTRGSMVAAHRSLRFGTRIQFKYKGRTVTAVVKDRGPFVRGRAFDLGPGTAKKLGFSGVGRVRWRIVK